MNNLNKIIDDRNKLQNQYDEHGNFIMTDKHIEVLNNVNDYQKENNLSIEEVTNKIKTLDEINLFESRFGNSSSFLYYQKRSIKNLAQRSSKCH